MLGLLGFTHELKRSDKQFYAQIYSTLLSAIPFSYIFHTLLQFRTSAFTPLPPFSLPSAYPYLT